MKAVISGTGQARSRAGGTESTEPSSAWAKYADALHRIALAWRNSRFSRSSDMRRSTILVGTPARLPLSTSTFFFHS